MLHRSSSRQTGSESDFTTHKYQTWNDAGYRRHAGIAVLLLALLMVPALSLSGAFAAPANSTSLKAWAGETPPSFVLDDLHGARRALQAFRGKVVLVHFFATWCEPCVAEITSLQRLALGARDAPLAIVAVDVAEVDLRVRAFFDKLPVDFPVLLDRDRAVTKAWGISALPSTFVLDSELTPRFFVEGDLDWSRPDILKTIQSLYPAHPPTN